VLVGHPLAAVEVAATFEKFMKIKTNPKYFNRMLLVACFSGLCSCSAQKSDEKTGQNQQTKDMTNSDSEPKTEGIASDFDGVWITKNGDQVVAKCEYLDGKKHGKETRYYNTEGRDGDLMAIQYYKNGVKDGISERYEMTTHVLLSRCIYREGVIWSGAALDNGGVIDPENVLVQDLPYRVAVYISGKIVQKELAATYFKKNKMEGG